MQVSARRGAYIQFSSLLHCAEQSNVSAPTMTCSVILCPSLPPSGPLSSSGANKADLEEQAQMKVIMSHNPRNWVNAIASITQAEVPGFHDVQQ